MSQNGQQSAARAGGDRSVANAQGAPDVIQTAPVTVDSEIAAMDARVSAQAAREARYGNHTGVFKPDDTVLDVIDDGSVPETLAACYGRSADTVVSLRRERGQTYVELDVGSERRAITTLSTPPFIQFGGH